jgi:hypothetical protein
MKQYYSEVGSWVLLLSKMQGSSALLYLYQRYTISEPHIPRGSPDVPQVHYRAHKSQSLDNILSSGM